MKKFNENPFNKNTEVTCFSTGSEHADWMSNNCEKCDSFEDDSKCKLSFHIGMSCIVGHIPLWVAKNIGVRYDPLYQRGNLGECIEMRGIDDPPF